MWDVAAGRYFEFMKALLHEDEDEDEDAETPRETNADMVLHKIKVRPHD
jgi:protein-disulfide isomerase